MANTPTIRRKLRIVILLTCGLALLLTSGILFAYQYLVLKQSALRNLHTTGQVIAANSTAALAFQNKDDASDILSALRTTPQIIAAALYDKEGKLFATYPRETRSADFPAQPPADGYAFKDGELLGVESVAEQVNERLGTLYLRSNLRSLNAAVVFSGFVVFAALIVSLAAAYLVSTRLQREITQPVLSLASTAKAVSERRDYSVRAQKTSDDELGQLTDAFNHMLLRIEKQLGHLDLLQKITRAIAERQDMPSIFKVVLARLENDLPIDFALIALYESPASSLTLTSVGAKSAPIARELGLNEGSQIPLEKNGLSRCVQGALVYEADLRHVYFQFPTLLTRGGLLSAVFAPLLVEDKVFGVLVAARKEANEFSSGDCEFLRHLSEQVALAANQSKLHETLKQAYDDLRQTQHTVMQQERLRALGQMASGIAHDINNAISPVTLYTESLLEREPNLSERARGYIKVIHQAIGDVADTVGRMREFYRHREPQLSLAIVDANQLVQQVIDMTRARWSAEAQGRSAFIELQTHLAADLPRIMGADGEIRDALTNLIFNAVDAMPSGGMLTIATRVNAATDESSKLRTPSSVIIEVRDTGVGMDAETRQRCLEPFFTTKGERGTGLGLAMVYGMVKRHSADLEIDSVPGKGTMVRLIFAAATPEFVRTMKFPALPFSTRPLKILIVDDDPLLIKSLRDILEADGHEVVAANGGEQGIDTFFGASEGRAFSLVITDLGMPYVDGLKVAAAIKSRVLTVPIVLLTGWGQRLLEQDQLPPNIDRVLAKPPRLHELRTAFVELDARMEAASPTSGG